MLTQIRRYEPGARSGQTLAWGMINEQGRVAGVHLIIDMKLMIRMRKLAARMYSMDFAGDPRLKEIANDIIEQSLPQPRRPSELWEAQ